MHILITNAALDGLAGTELVIDEIARELRRRRHRVTIFTPRPGLVAKALASGGIRVVTSPEEIPADVDIIHGQHHLPAMIALAALPKTPAIYYIHGYAPWEEQPPRHPRIRKYLSVAPRLERWVRNILSLPPSASATLANWVDLRKYARVREAVKTPTRAVVFSNHCKPEHAEILEEACRRSGIDLTKIGRAFGKSCPDPESVLPQFDIAFASGRSALEAMASGCAVIPFRNGLIAPLVEPGSFAVSAERNFTVEPDGNPMDIDAVIAEIQSYKADDTSSTTHRIRREFSLESAVDALEHHYASAMLTKTTHPTDPNIESQCLAEYLYALATHEREQLVLSEERITRLNKGWEETKQKRKSLSAKMDSAKKKLGLVEKHLSRGVFRQPLLQRIRSGWSEIDSGEYGKLDDQATPPNF